MLHSIVTASADAAGSRGLVDRARRTRGHLTNEPRLTAAMESAGLDAVIASSPANVTYTAGAWLSLPLLYSFVVTDGSGRRAIVINEADTYFLRDVSTVDDIRPFAFGPDAAEDAIALLRDVLADFGLLESRIGIELDYLPSAAYTALREGLPTVDWQDGSAAFDYARLVKTDGEIELFRAVARATEQAIEDGFAAVQAGATEKELATEMQARVLAYGADSLLHAHVHAGVHSTVVHALSLEEPIRPGEVIHVDFGACFAGYSTDLSRNAVVGEPSLRQAEIYGLLWDIHQIALASVKPGMTAAAVFEGLQPEFAARGLVHPWGTIGHSTGLDVHEGFELAVGSDVLLEPGMIVQVEPSHIEVGDARYHLEDSVLITEDGCEILSNVSTTEQLFEIR
jgi:Xaa-Pro aminopeptidase